MLKQSIPIYRIDYGGINKRQLIQYNYNKQIYRTIISCDINQMYIIEYI